MEETQISERECRNDPDDDKCVSMETSNRLYQLRKATMQAANELSVAPLDAATPGSPADACSLPSQSVLPFPSRGGSKGRAGGVLEICQNEPAAIPVILPKRTYRTLRRVPEPQEAAAEAVGAFGKQRR